MESRRRDAAKSGTTNGPIAVEARTDEAKDGNQSPMGHRRRPKKAWGVGRRRSSARCWSCAASSKCVDDANGEMVWTGVLMQVAEVRSRGRSDRDALSLEFNLLQPSPMRKAQIKQQGRRREGTEIRGAKKKCADRRPRARMTSSGSHGGLLPSLGLGAKTPPKTPPKTESAPANMLTSNASATFSAETGHNDAQHARSGKESSAVRSLGKKQNRYASIACKSQHIALDPCPSRHTVA